MPDDQVDPYAIPCPFCTAGVRAYCVRERDGTELAPDKPHARRVKAARQELAAARKRADGDATQRIESPRFRRLYAACRLELEQRADWTTLAAEQLEGLVLNLQDAHLAREERAGKLTTEGSMGQKVPHPNLASELRLEAQALATARALKLTPDTRGTSAPRPGDEDVPQETAADAEDRDELAELDDLAKKRKAKASGGGRSKRRRGG